MNIRSKVKVRLGDQVAGVSYAPLSSVSLAIIIIKLSESTKSSKWVKSSKLRKLN